VRKREFLKHSNTENRENIFKELTTLIPYQVRDVLPTNDKELLTAVWFVKFERHKTNSRND